MQPTEFLLRCHKRKKNYMNRLIASRNDIVGSELFMAALRGRSQVAEHHAVTGRRIWFASDLPRAGIV